MDQRVLPAEWQVQKQLFMDSRTPLYQGETPAQPSLVEHPELFQRHKMDREDEILFLIT